MQSTSQIICLKLSLKVMLLMAALFHELGIIDVMYCNSRDPFDDETFCPRDNVDPVWHTTNMESRFDVETYHSDSNGENQLGRQPDLDDVTGSNDADAEPGVKNCGRTAKTTSGFFVNVEAQLGAATNELDPHYDKQREENDVTDVITPPQAVSLRVDSGSASGHLSSSPPTGNMLLSARRLPKAAVALLRFPYDSIRRELDSTGNSSSEDCCPTAAETPPLPSQPSSSSSPSSLKVDATSSATAVLDCLTPPVAAAHQGGLMSRTLGSISSLPSSLADLSSSLFVRAGSSDGGGPSPPRSALLEKTATSAPGSGGGAVGDKSPGPVPSQSSTRAFLFQPLERLVRGSKSVSGDAEAGDGGAIPNDGKSCFRLGLS